MKAMRIVLDCKAGEWTRWLEIEDAEGCSATAHCGGPSREAVRIAVY